MYSIGLCKKNIMTSTCCATWTCLIIFVLEEIFLGKKKWEVPQGCVPELSWYQNPVTPQSLLPFTLSFLTCSLCLSKDHQVVNDHSVVYSFVHNFPYKGKVIGGEGGGGVVMDGQIEYE